MRRPVMGAVRGAQKPVDLCGFASQIPSRLAVDREWMTSPHFLENNMAPKNIFGIFLLLGGITLLLFGMNASHSFADQASNTFTGRFTDQTMWYMIIGGAAALLGLLSVLVGFRGKSA
jgi:hypothetical protein